MLLYFYKIKLISRTKPSRENGFTQRVEKYKLLNLVETFYGCKQPQKSYGYTRKLPDRLNWSWIFWKKYICHAKMK